MKKLLLILLIIGAAGCELDIKEVYEVDAPQIVTIDSCEYFRNSTHNSYYVYTHKGNCKNCRKFYKELLKEK